MTTEQQTSMKLNGNSKNKQKAKMLGIQGSCTHMNIPNNLMMKYHYYAFLPSVEHTCFYFSDHQTKITYWKPRVSPSWNS